MTTEDKKIVILLNDQDQLMARVCKNKFQKEQGWDSIITADYDTALKEIKEKKPNIVLTDILLNTTEKNGFDLITEIGADNSFDKTVIIVFTELSQDSDKNKAKEIGANEYFVKSQMTIKEVIEKIKSLV